MRATLVLPDLSKVPTGGLRVAYELANGLARRGHAVRLLHVDRRTTAARLRSAGQRVLGRPAVRWFKIDPSIEVGIVNGGRLDELPAADVLVAVGWRCVELVRNAPPRAGSKLHLIQGYMAGVEGEPGEVDRAWRLPIDKLVVSRWLAGKALELCPGVSISLVPVAVDRSRFTITADPALRAPVSVVLLDHSMPTKGTDDGLAALARVRQAVPDLRVTVFGAGEPMRAIPGWATFVRLPPDLAELYKSNAILVHPSSLEGWPLTPAEAMACGCVVVGYANLGISEYAVDGHNALLTAVGDIDALAASVARVIADDELRLRLARQAATDIGAFTWERSIDAFEQALASSRERSPAARGPAPA